jgi:hypothetical protein
MNFTHPISTYYMKTEKLILLFAWFACVTHESYAQPFPPQPRAIPPPVGAPVPIDSEIWILVLSGVLLGIFFLIKKAKPTA